MPGPWNEGPSSAYHRACRHSFASRYLLLALLAPAALRAQAPPPAPIPFSTTPAVPPSAEARQAELQAAWKEAGETGARGPAVVALRDQGKLTVPAGMVFISQAAATRLSRAMGNQVGPNFVGIMTNFSDADSWIVFVNWTPDGYIRDDDAKELNPDDILKNLSADSGPWYARGLAGGAREKRL